MAELQEAILTGELAPGEPLRLARLADALDMSPMPVREAVRQLERLGLAEHVPHRGARVSALSVDDLRDTYEARSRSRGSPSAAPRSASRTRTPSAARRCSTPTCAPSARVTSAAAATRHGEFHFALYDARRLRLAAAADPAALAEQRALSHRLALRARRRWSAAGASTERILDACVDARAGCAGAGAARAPHRHGARRHAPHATQPRPEPGVSHRRKGVVRMATTEDRRTTEGQPTSAEREEVPFRVRTADGDTIELSYSSPRPAAEHDELAVLESLPWFEPGKPLRNFMLHETDFADEVEAIWGRPWGAEGIGTLREVLVSRPTENEVRDEYAREWQYYYSSAAGQRDLGRLQAQFDEYYDALERNGVRVNYIEPPVPAIGAYGYIKNLVTLAGGGLVVRGGAIMHRYGLGSWQRGREVIWTKVLAALQVPIYLTVHGTGICEPGAGRWLDSHTFVFNESVVANEEGLRQLEWVLSNLGVELVVAHSPGWYDSIGHGNIGTSHMDMVMLTLDERKVLLAPHLVNYGFVRYLMRNDYTVIEVPVEEYWDLAINGVDARTGEGRDERVARRRSWATSTGELFAQ